MNITVVGIGYVGLSMAVLLSLQSQNNTVTAIDISYEKLKTIEDGKSPINDDLIEQYLSTKSLNLKTTMDKVSAYKKSDFIIISVPTNYDPSTNYFDTSIVENTISEILEVNRDATIVIKSTVPVGFTESICDKFGYDKILFSPEFLREGHALYDNLYPSRIVVGYRKGHDALHDKASEFANLLKNTSLKSDVEILYTALTEAEAIKLFSNTYLALRISFFNELDTYAAIKNLDTKSIIDGVCLDRRIGNIYNNPSFGYGGYCLPKDTLQLKANYKNVPENLISAIVESNATRKDFITEQIETMASVISKSNSEKRDAIAKQILETNGPIGIYRLSMKSNSDNFRESAVIGIINRINSTGTKVIIYEPQLASDEFLGNKVITNLLDFKRLSRVIVANRYSSDLSDVIDKLYTRDIYLRD